MSEIPVVTQILRCPECGKLIELEDANKYDMVECCYCEEIFDKPDPTYFIMPSWWP